MGITDRLGLGGLRVPTYEAGLLQAKAYRAFRTHLSRKLAPRGLTTPEWALLGQLYDRGSMRLSDISEMLRVESPLATNLVNGLAHKRLVERHRDKEDGRARQVKLTQKGQQLVPRLERELRRDFRQFFGDVSPP